MAGNTYALTGNQRSAHKKTLTANQVDRVTIAKTNIDQVEVITDGSADVYVRVDSADPVVDGAFAYRMPAAGNTVVRVIDVAASDSGGDVRLISTGTPVYSVTAIDPAQ